MVSWKEISFVRTVFVFAFFAVVRDAKPDEFTKNVDSKAAAIERLDDDATRALYEIFDYDRSIPLEARIVEKRARDGVIREKIVFRGVQGFLVPAYLEYPSIGNGPYPCVFLLHGWSGSKENWWQDGGYISGGNVRHALLESGYSVMALDAQIHGDRISQNDYAPVNHFADPALENTPRKGYFTQRDIYIQTTRDYRRAIDFLETRSEIISSRIGMLGYSMGGAQTFLLTGVDTRIKVSVSIAAPADRSQWSPIAPQNFTNSIADRPFLMILGRTDEMCSQVQAREIFELVNSSRKKLIFIDGGHRLPPEYVPQAIDWIRKHL